MITASEYTSDFLFFWVQTGTSIPRPQLLTAPAFFRRDLYFVYNLFYVIVYIPYNYVRACLLIVIMM